MRYSGGTVDWLRVGPLAAVVMGGTLVVLWSLNALDATTRSSPSSSSSTPHHALGFPLEPPAVLKVCVQCSTRPSSDPAVSQSLEHVWLSPLRSVTNVVVSFIARLRAVTLSTVSEMSVASTVLTFPSSRLWPANRANRARQLKHPTSSGGGYFQSSSIWGSYIWCWSWLCRSSWALR